MMLLILPCSSEPFSSFWFMGVEPKQKVVDFTRMSLVLRKWVGFKGKKSQREELQQSEYKYLHASFSQVLAWLLSYAIVEQDPKKHGRKQWLKAKQMSRDFLNIVLGRQILTIRPCWDGGASLKSKHFQPRPQEVIPGKYCCGLMAIRTMV